ncbi:heme o synthase [Alienimonas chondri]|uniref:heme o synthase n=1 Tax=Alienimonas chondri TaxID=2681879 RepID=UPI0028F45784|nr:heme o synthase [Alienimonas chondri]
MADSRPLTTRLADYRTLAKPKIAAMALVTVALGYLAAGGSDPVTLLHASIGIALVAAASGALNQFAERDTDARMTRTANRPLPAGRLSETEALVFGIVCGVAGADYLAFTVNPFTALLALLTLALYVGVYTPLKRSTAWSVVIGAVPGALPPVLGWAAAGGGAEPGTWLTAAGLFGILFLWQFPHFMAIAWLNREQYKQAGLHMLPGQIPRVGWAGKAAALTALALLPVGLLPTVGGGVGLWTAVTATLAGAIYLYYSVRFAQQETRPTARAVLFASLGYLPALLLAAAIELLVIR